MADEQDLMGYDLPSDIPTTVAGSASQYYDHPAGTYIGFVGKLVPRYKDLQGNKCEKGADGAMLSSVTLYFYLQKYLPLTGDPVVLIKPGIEPKMIPDLSNPYILRYAKPIFFKPEDQWQYHKLFADWKNGNENIVGIDPNNRAQKLLNLKGIAMCFGRKVQLTVAEYKPGKLRLMKAQLDPSPALPASIFLPLIETVDKAIDLANESKRSQNNSGIAPSSISIDDFDMSEYDSGEVPF